MTEPKVLVAAPTYSGMEYCLKEWADAYKAFTYENRGALFIDNTDANLHYTHLCRAQGIPTIYQEKRFKFLWDTLELAWRRIVEYAHDEGYDLICSLEADIIAPPETLDVLVGEWLEHGPKAVVAHRYHPRGVDRRCRRDSHRQRGHTQRRGRHPTVTRSRQRHRHGVRACPLPHGRSLRCGSGRHGDGERGAADAHRTGRPWCGRRYSDSLRGGAGTDYRRRTVGGFGRGCCLRGAAHPLYRCCSRRVVSYGYRLGGGTQSDHRRCA